MTQPTPTHNPTHSWPGHLLDDPHHPWVDSGGHAEARRRALVIAHDLVANRRWLVGANDPVPVYDPTDGSYVGDDSDDRVRCQTHLLRIRVPNHVWDRLDVSDRDHLKLVYGMAEVAYRALLARPLHAAAELRDELIAMLADGRLQDDEHPWAALRRLVANGYTVEMLRAEVGP